METSWTPMVPEPLQELGQDAADCAGSKQLYLGIFDLHGESRGFLEAFLSWQKFGECLPGDVLKLLFDSNSYVCATAARALVAFGAEGAKTLMDRRQ